jgi:endonuclease YncB( thermonuclease family)
VDLWSLHGRQLLREGCFKKRAVLKPQTTDRYGRNVARVECDGVDANAEQTHAITFSRASA